MHVFIPLLHKKKLFYSIKIIAVVLQCITTWGYLDNKYSFKDNYIAAHERLELMDLQEASHKIIRLESGFEDVQKKITCLYLNKCIKGKNMILPSLKMLVKHNQNWLFH